MKCMTAGSLSSSTSGSTSAVVKRRSTMRSVVCTTSPVRTGPGLTRAAYDRAQTGTVRRRTVWPVSAERRAASSTRRTPTASSGSTGTGPSPRTARAKPR